MLVYLKGKQVGKPPFIHTDSVIFVVFSLEHNLYPITQIPHYSFPKYNREFNFFIKRKRNPNTILKIKKSFFLLRKLKEGKIKERDRGTLLEPRPELVERNMVAASSSHGDWASTSLFLDFPQTQTLTFSDLGLNQIGKAGSPQPPPPMVASSLLQPKSLSLSLNLISFHRSNLKDHQLLSFSIFSKPKP